MQLSPPVQVALARRCETVPAGDQWSIEPKFDGWRVLVFHTPAGVVLQARSGRPITSRFPDLGAAALRLPVGTVLDGELVVWHEGRCDFHAVQRRALSSPQRALHLASRHPASIAAFDLLEADDVDLRPLPYAERRARLLDVVAPVGPPIQPVPATRDRTLALEWWEAWRPDTVGIEGLVAKHVRGRYRGGVRDWRKVKHWDAR